MRKALLIATFLFFCFNANSQSLTFNDLLNLYHKQNAKSFLSPKHFSFSALGPGHTMYYKPNGPKTMERVICNVKAISYTTDVSYISAIVKQIPKQYALISKDAVGVDMLYRYGNSKLLITVDITQKAGLSGSISISKKQ